MIKERVERDRMLLDTGTFTKIAEDEKKRAVRERKQTQQFDFQKEGLNDKSKRAIASASRRQRKQVERYDTQKEGLNDKSRKALNTTPVKQKTTKLKASTIKKPNKSVDISTKKGKRGKALF